MNPFGETPASKRLRWINLLFSSVFLIVGIPAILLATSDVYDPPLPRTGLSTATQPVQPPQTPAPSVSQSITGQNGGSTSSAPAAQNPPSPPATSSNTPAPPTTPVASPPNTAWSITEKLFALGKSGFLIIAVYSAFSIFLIAAAHILYGRHVRAAPAQAHPEPRLTRRDIAAAAGWRSSTLYFVGFLGTLWALALSFAAMDLGNLTTEISRQTILILLHKVGAALTSTIFGLATRNFFEAWFGPAPPDPRTGGCCGTAKKKPACCGGNPGPDGPCAGGGAAEAAPTAADPLGNTPPPETAQAQSQKPKPRYQDDLSVWTDNLLGWGIRRGQGDRGRR
jgi:hypothetical protein